MNKEEKEHEANMQGQKESEHNKDGREQEGNVDMEEQETDQQEHERIIDTECIVQISDENTPEEMRSIKNEVEMVGATVKEMLVFFVCQAIINISDFMTAWPFKTCLHSSPNSWIL